jgi:hypothetical protein
LSFGWKTRYMPSGQRPETSRRGVGLISCATRADAAKMTPVERLLLVASKHHPFVRRRLGQAHLRATHKHPMSIIHLASTASGPCLWPGECASF